MLFNLYTGGNIGSQCCVVDVIQRKRSKKKEIAKRSTQTIFFLFSLCRYFVAGNEVSPHSWSEAHQQLSLLLVYWLY